MSYSFNVRGATKEAVKAALRIKFAEIAAGQVCHQRDQAQAAGQVCHQRDQAQAVAAADAFVDLVADDETKDVVISMSGSLMGQWQGSDVVRIENAAVSLSAYLAERTPAA